MVNGHLSPLLFGFFINDLLEKLSDSGVGCSGYADDVKLFLAIKSTMDCTKLHDSLLMVHKWCEDNGMMLNPSKCNVISFSRKRSPLTATYSIHGTAIGRVSVIKDLGVFLNTKLNFHHQVDRVTAKARSVLGMVKRFSRGFDDKRVSLTLYRSLVRSLLEYTTQVWAPFRSTQIARVESVQKQFLLWFLQDRFPRHQYPLPPYAFRLALTELDSIEHRHRLAIATFAFDITKGLIN